MTMRLHWSPRSPFVRKVMIAAHELGLADRIATMRTVAAMTKPNADLLPDNPLSKIPTLVLEDGTVLYDSVVICEYLDSLAGGRLFPREGAARWVELRRHAMLNGLLDLLILWRNEREKAPPSQPLLDAFAVKTRHTLAALEREIGAIAVAPLGIAQITAGVLGAYLDFRLADLEWRKAHPRYAEWHAGFAQRPSMRATEIVDG